KGQEKPEYLKGKIKLTPAPGLYKGQIYGTQDGQILPGQKGQSCMAFPTVRISRPSACPG
ncbi:MAG: hypothetical protein PUK16_07400, partial [Prevotellaceae bacterium]|nr:hypothetical protein [Prevotellaceae bacterium]